MSVSIISKKNEPRAVTLKLSDGSLVHGKVNLHRNNIDIQRVSDFFIKGTDPFIVVFEATHEDAKTGKVLIINKNNIVWVSPEDGPGQENKPRQEEVNPEDSSSSFLDGLRST